MDEKKRRTHTEHGTINRKIDERNEEAAETYFLSES